MEFTITDIERLCEIDRNRLYQWMREGYIGPSVQKASGHGTKNVWSFADLVRIQTFQMMVATGWKREAASRVLNSPRCYASLGLFPDKADITWHDSAEEQHRAVTQHTEGYRFNLVYLKYLGRSLVVSFCTVAEHYSNAIAILLKALENDLSEENHPHPHPVEMYSIDATPIVLGLAQRI
ncbi:hypothetical protein [Pseudodesulfovibrio indicus]|uniref:HTH merR-type domain-containing protein n=1 Tax=Pseudodesulfovibrio indicus TaxID=1716143 RepID=A0ABM5YYC3_9BACT|nr:hypothetical protein [Pseudodesulfovibrio indicus]AMK12463.1 hypothetical protein AWY79_15820 [Pseudodesulfovibrio indicus]